MEMDEVQNRNHTTNGSQIYPARVDVTSRLPSLAATTTGCNSMDPRPPRPLPPTDPPTPLPLRLYAFSEAVSMEFVPTIPHAPHTGQVPGRARITATLNLRSGNGPPSQPDCEE